MKSNKNNFHQTVSEYYDKDAELGFEARAMENPLLEKIRNDFRKLTIKYPFSSVLEIGCGPGFDVEWFASSYPEKSITGIDISAKMVEQAKLRIKASKLNNATAIQLDERAMLQYFGKQKFDLVYVYFGALNTVDNLGFAAEQIYELLKPGGHAVLTFVNKWYLREMLVQSLKLKPNIAFSRLRKVWGGYSPNRFLPSKCYSSGYIKNAFRNFKILERKGYSITFPAWYNFKKYLKLEEKTDKLWNTDQKLQKSFLWSKGEYLLFVFKKD